ncbi:MAG: V/A-type H+/Na+-transporting ATPase subunit, partial [Eubacteriaceae bacterium]|nr:V/A-type H+/Na+-transporting ATPase subunit [Eubacteriaceae bacterium]
MKKEYLRIDKVVGPLIEISDVDDVFYGEVVNIVDAESGNIKKGKVIKIEEDKVTIQVFQNTSGLAAGNSVIKFTGQAFNLPVSLDL